VDPSEAPFVYALQLGQARRAALMSFDRLVASSQALAPPEKLAILFSTGRCGSTLASRIFAQIPEVWSLSEPDYLTNLAVDRHHLSPNDLVELIRAATLWTCRPPSGRRATTMVLKPRSEAVIIAEACQCAFPDARNVFMYRDHLGYLNSCFKFVQRVVPPEILSTDEPWLAEWDYLMVVTPITLLDDLFPADHGPIGWPEFLTLAWDLRIEGYLRAVRQGMNLTPIHYRDLNADRLGQTHRLLTACDLDAAHLETAMLAFAEDSHKGSADPGTAGGGSLLRPAARPRRRVPDQRGDPAALCRARHTGQRRLASLRGGAEGAWQDL
jgi:hypothetical protein